MTTPLAEAAQQAEVAVIEAERPYSEAQNHNALVRGQVVAEQMLFETAKQTAEAVAMSVAKATAEVVYPEAWQEGFKAGVPAGAEALYRYLAETGQLLRPGEVMDIRIVEDIAPPKVKRVLRGRPTRQNPAGRIEGVVEGRLP